MEGLVRNSRGVALILTILIVSLIVALTLDFNRTMRTHVVSAGNIRHGLKALYIAKSGVSYGLAMLKDDSFDVDSVLDDWADPDKIALASAGSQMLFGGRGFGLQIEDLSGKIQINKLIDKNVGSKVENVFGNLLRLEEFGLDADQVNEILAAIKDWIDNPDPDEITQVGVMQGAEDDHYQSLERPYHCKNGPLDSLEELLLVRGITPELFHGTREKLGIASYISVFGDGKININTADPIVLESLHEDITSEMAKDMADYRLNVEEEELKSKTWYKKPEAGVPNDITIDNSKITTTSKYFQITSVGYFGDMSKRVVAVVKRDDEGFQTLSWKIE